MSSPEISVNDVIQVRPNQVSCDLAGEVAILNMDTGVYFGLDPIGARVWSLLQEPRSVAAVRDALLEEYDVDAERCGQEVLALVQRMEQNGLVEARN